MTGIAAKQSAGSALPGHAEVPMGLTSIPEWLAAALLAATLGFVGKQIFEWIAALGLQDLAPVEAPGQEQTLSTLDGGKGACRNPVPE